MSGAGGVRGAGGDAAGSDAAGSGVRAGDGSGAAGPGGSGGSNGSGGPGDRGRAGAGGGVLHLQCRAYPLHHSTPGFPDGTAVPGAPLPAFDVPGHGELRPVVGTLRSLSYNPDATVELDLTAVVAGAVALPGVEIAACRARILPAGTVLVVYALRHAADLRLLDLPELDALDARINRALREADAPVLTAVLAASIAAGLVGGVALRPDLALNGDRSPVDRRSARYNAHFVTADPPWPPDPRVPPGLIAGPDCRILLPYTYAWDRDPGPWADGGPGAPDRGGAGVRDRGGSGPRGGGADTVAGSAPAALPDALLNDAFDDLLTMTEPADIAVAQQSLLVGSLIAGRWVLADLARGHPDSTDVHAFRRFLDGLWSDYHHLDGYRIESTQGHRAAYLAARQVIGLDDTQERADKLLGYVSNSLLAAASMRSEVLDTRLNRLAAALAVVSAASFGLDIAVFVLPQVSLGTKLGVVAGLIGMAVSCLMAVIVPGRTAPRDPAARVLRAGRAPRAAGPPVTRPAPRRAAWPTRRRVPSQRPPADDEGVLTPHGR